jgi:hypothetical protein
MSDNTLWNLESGLDTRQVRCLGLTRVKAGRPDMSCFTFWNPKQEPDKSSWDIATEELGMGQTCLAKITGIRISLVNPRETERPDMSRLGARHVRLGFLESD